MLWPVAAWAAGIALARTDLLPVGMALAPLASLVGLLFYLRQRVVAVVLCAGVLWGVADLLLDARQVAVDEQWLAEDAMVSAAVERVEKGAAYTRLQLSDVTAENGRELPGMALLYLYGKEGKKPVAAGQKIRARVHWRLPRNYLNPGGFDYRVWCFDRHIALIGSVRGGLEISDSSVPWLESLRQRIRAAIARSGAESGVLDALLLGERSRVSEAAAEAFSATGTAHLLAISGMHVGMAAAWVFALVWWLLTRYESWIVRVPVRAAALSAGCLAALVYATLAGWPLPAIRSSLMLASGVLAWWLAVRGEAVNILLAALGLILLFDPSAIASLSLWLSFAATSAILLWGGRPDEDQPPALAGRIWRAMKMVAWVSLLAALATLPMIVSAFGRLPVYSLPANLIAVPLYGLIVMPLTLLGELSALCGLETLAAGLMWISGHAVQAGLSALGWIAALPAGQLWAIKPPLWTDLLYVACMLAAGWLYWRGKRTVAGCGLLLVLAVYSTLVLNERDVAVPTWLAWDVGQGAASSLLLPGNQVIAVDAPGYRGSRFNGGTTMAAGLRSMGITHIDLLILTHAQSDHLGGALSLLKQLNHVGQIWLPDTPAARADDRVQEIMAHAAGRHIPVRWLAAGDRVSAGRLDISVLWPPRGYESANANNLSLVISASMDGYFRLLWPGDIEAAAERHLIGNGLRPVSAMLVPHHGSATSSRAEFVEALQPELAVAQTGFGNRYGFPDAGVIKRYRDTGTQFLDTAAGAVMVRWSEPGESPVIEQWQPDKDYRRTLIQRLIRRWSP